MVKTIKDFEQPRVNLKLDFGAGCALEVLINDIPVTPQKFHHGGPSALYMPISHYLVPGENSISLLAWRSSKFDLGDLEQGQCSLSLVAWDKKSMRPDSKEAITIGEVAFSLHDIYQFTIVDKSITDGLMTNQDVKRIVTGEQQGSDNRGFSVTPINASYSSVDGLTLQREFQLDIPIYRSKWLDSPIIEDSAATHDSLFAEYQRLVTVLKSGDLKKWMLLNEEKYAEGAKLTGVTPEQLWAESVYLPAMITGEDKDWKLVELDESNTMLLIYGNGRIATLLEKSWSPILSYDSLIDDDYYSIIPVFFRLDKNGNWKIVR